LELPYKLESFGFEYNHRKIMTVSPLERWCISIRCL